MTRRDGGRFLIKLALMFLVVGALWTPLRNGIDALLAFAMARWAPASSLAGLAEAAAAALGLFGALVVATPHVTRGRRAAWLALGGAALLVVQAALTGLTLVAAHGLRAGAGYLHGWGFVAAEAARIVVPILLWGGFLVRSAGWARRTYRSEQAAPAMPRSRAPLRPPAIHRDEGGMPS